MNKTETSGSATAPVSFDHILSELAFDATGADVVPPHGWGQGRALFGGVVAGMAIAAGDRITASGAPLRSMQVAFAGPVNAGEPLRLAVDVLRRGRSVVQTAVQLRQGDSVRASVHLCYATDRPSDLAVDPAAQPELPGPDGLDEMPFIEGVVPAFLQHFALRWAEGTFPYTGNPATAHAGWCRFRSATAGGAGAPHIAALVDTWPNPAAQALPMPAPASSVTWSLELLPIPGDEPVDEWWCYRSAADATAGGIVHAHAQIWSPGGRLAALSRQTYAVFDRR